VIAKRRGVVARRGLKEAWSKRMSQTYEPIHKRPDERHTVLDERADDREVHIHQGHRL
jgi:hypothetical protein